MEKLLKNTQSTVGPLMGFEAPSHHLKLDEMNSIKTYQ